MYFLGLGGSNHDQSAALVKDGKVVIAVEDERVIRTKKGVSHWAGKPCLAATEYCLEAAGIQMQDLAGIYVNDDIDTAFPFWEEYDHKLLPHHQNHAMSAFLNSPFERSALLVIDGKGTKVSGSSASHFETVSIGQGGQTGCSLETFQSGHQKMSTASWRFVVENSLGWFYRTITDAIGFGQSGEGKTMGLASYGTPRLANAIMDYCHYDQDGRFFYDAYGGLWDFLIRELSQDVNAFQMRADLAASGQKILEEGVLLAAKAARERTGEKDLCYSGGVALNGVANFRIQAEAGFDEIFLWPPCGDNGLAVGAALYGYYSTTKTKRVIASRTEIANSAFCGRTYSDSDIEKALNSFSISYTKLRDPCRQVVKLIAMGEPVAVCRGKSEIGPRALGHRSILADPTNPRMADFLNRVKGRESFRPFAPIVLDSRMRDYFDSTIMSPFMLSIAPVREDAIDALPAITHVDGTARLQTVPDDGDPFIVGILQGLADNGSPPVVLNTSFNLAGEPIVETPCDAIDAFLRLDIGHMILGDYHVTKRSLEV